jgi:nucleoid DNA-binding protein
MNKSDLINIVYNKLSIPKKDCEAVIETLFESMEEALLNEEDIMISGFGSFEVKKTSAKKITDLHTKEDIVLPETKQVKFRSSKKFKQKIKN